LPTVKTTRGIPITGSCIGEEFDKAQRTADVSRLSERYSLGGLPGVEAGVREPWKDNLVS